MRGKRERMGRKVFYFILFLHSSVQQPSSSWALTPRRVRSYKPLRKLHRLRPFQWCIKTFKTFFSLYSCIYIYTQYTTPKSVRGTCRYATFESTQDSFIIGINSEMYVRVFIYIYIYNTHSFAPTGFTRRIIVLSPPPPSDRGGG